MKKEIIKEIKIPEGVEVSIEDSMLIIKGKEGENKKLFRLNKIEIKKEGEKVIMISKKATKKEKRMINAISAHITNMIKGVQERFEYTLKICFSHFPFNIEVKGRDVIIKNFLGEKIPRRLEIPKGVDIKSDRDTILVSSTDKELAGQVAANLEKVTKVKNRDKRIFQDGIYITKKAGEEI